MAIAENIDLLDEGDRDRSRGPLFKFFGVIFDPKAYGAIAYMLLSLPLGIAYFVGVVTGSAVSVAMLILIIGLVLLPSFFAIVRLFSLVEGYIVGILLGAKIPHKEDFDDDDVETGDLKVSSFDGDGSEVDDDGDEKPGNRFWNAVKGMFTDIRSYTSMIYMLLMLPLGISYFTVAVTGFTISIAFIFAPIAKSLGLEHINMDSSGTNSEAIVQLTEFVNSPVGLIVMMIVGFLGFFLMMHLSRGVGWVHARFAEAMLVKRR
jgi:putative sensor protein